MRTYDRLYKDMKKEWKKNYKLLSTAADYGTVGAVAIDREGNLASAARLGVVEHLFRNKT
jgi:isoaspartyl peptidase/L-asparaginase-like protein (Ntn-hydrolase superfamily)